MSLPSRVFALASRDYAHEWQMSGCFILALAAVLGPMLVLFGLKFGIVGNMLDDLIQDPRNREIRPIGSGRFEANWFTQLRQRDDIAFVVPRTRSIAATMQLGNPAAGHIITVEVIPSGAGDPLLSPVIGAPQGLRQVVLSQSAAEKLGVAAGDTVHGSLTRRFGGKKERGQLDLQVLAVAPAGAFGRAGAFAAIELVEALEDFRDGRAVPELGWTGDAPVVDRAYPGFRLYAQSIYDIAALRDLFAEQGLEVRTRVEDIELVQRMDRNLTTVYWSIAAIGMIGFSLSLGASLWANVDRKRKELSVLRLVGFRTADIIWFPVLQALYTGLFGWALAVGIFYAAAWAINDMLASQLQTGEEFCRLLPIHFLVALGLTTGSAMLAAALAGMRSARIEPSEALRDI